MDVPSYARQAYALQMQQLEHDLLDMGSRAEAMAADAVEALCSLDTTLAMDVIRRDDEIDRRDIDIEERCIQLLALQQPMAGDLRVIGTVLKMITDIERVGDLAVDVAKIAVKLEKESGNANCVDIRRIAGVARTMLREGLEAFVRRDLVHLEIIAQQEDEADRLYREIRGQIFDIMRKDPDRVVVAGWLLMVIHHLERIADHALNIAERVQFMVTGKLEPISPFRQPMP